MQRISKGDIPAKITENYNGVFNEIKDSLNQCIDVLNELANGVKQVYEVAQSWRNRRLDRYGPLRRRRIGSWPKG